MDAAGLDIVDFVDVGIEVRHHTCPAARAGGGAKPNHASLHAPGGIQVQV